MGEGEREIINMPSKEGDDSVEEEVEEDVPEELMAHHQERLAHDGVDELIKLDNKYRNIENEYWKEWALLQKKYEDRQKPLLIGRKEVIAAQRKKVVSELSAAKAKSKGEVGSGFWLSVLENHPIFSEEIQEWDKMTLSLLTDVRVESLEKENLQAGFKIIFEFDHAVKSPGWELLPFTNKELTRVFETKLENEFLTELSVKEIRMEEEIAWKPGQDLTVEIKKIPINKGPKGKKTGGGGGGAGKMKTQRTDRASFFRMFFRTLSMEDPDSMKDLLDKSLQEMGFDAEDADDEDELQQAYEDALEKVSDDAYEMGLCLRDNIIPFAVRWYTGQACSFEPESDEDGSEEEEEEEDEDDGEEGDSDEIENESDDDDNDASKEEDDDKKGKTKKKPVKKAKKGSGNTGAGGKKQEECNQQ